MRRLRVLVPGCNTAGRRSSLGALSGVRRPERVDVEVRLASGEVALLEARVPYFGSFWYESYADCRAAEHAWIRDAAEELFAFLPTIDGVVFVASSMPHRRGHNAGVLARLLPDLAAAGLDVARLPFVFQLNHRDHAHVMSLDKMIGDLSTPRCSYVESVAPLGVGVRDALDELTRLLDGAAGRARFDVFAAPSPTATPSSPRALFQPSRADATQGGGVFAEVSTATVEGVVDLREASAVLRAWPKEGVHERAFAAGPFRLEVAWRAVSTRAGDASKPWRRHKIAARLFLLGVAPVRYEALGPDGASRGSVFVGSPAALRELDQSDLPSDLLVRADEHGAAVAARAARADGPEKPKFEPASRGELGLLSTGWNDAHTWLGLDDAGRVVEVACCDDEGAAVLRELAAR